MNTRFLCLFINLLKHIDKLMINKILILFIFVYFCICLYIFVYFLKKAG